MMQHPEPPETAGDDLLQYSCPRCQAQLQASTQLAGTRQSCPTCEQSIQLPGIPTPAKPAGKSPSAAETANIPDSAQLALTCSQCGTRAFARGSQLGKTITCENCLEDILVVATLHEVQQPDVETPAVTTVKSTPGPQQQAAGQQATSSPGNSIQLTSDDVLPEPPPPPAPSPPSQPVNKTYDLAEVDLADPQSHAGQPASSAVEKEISLDGLTTGPVDARSTEEILKDLDPEGTSSRTSQSEAGPDDSYRFSISCLLCGTRLNVGSDDIGTEVRCPDCHSHTMVREPRREKRQPNKPPEEETDLHAQPAATASPRSGEAKKQLQQFMDKARSEVESKQDQYSELVNRGWWMTILSSMLQVDILIRVLMHSVIGFIAAVTLHYGYIYNMEDGIKAFISLILFAISTFFFVTIAASLIISIVTIIETRANGEREVETWPSLVFMDWIGMIPYVFVPLFIGVIPQLAWIPLTQGLSPAIVLSVGSMLTLLLFAPVILSTLSSGSPFAVISSRVIASMTLRPQVWCTFAVFVVALSPAMAGSLALLNGAGAGLILAGSFSFMVTSFFYMHVVAMLGFQIACYREGDQLDNLADDD